MNRLPDTDQDQEQVDEADRPVPDRQDGQSGRRRDENEVGQNDQSLAAESIGRVAGRDGRRKEDREQPGPVPRTRVPAESPCIVESQPTATPCI